MSNALKRALLLSMEGVGENEASEGEISEILAMAEPLKPIEGDGIGAITEGIAASNNVTNVLEDIAATAEEKGEGVEAPAMEALAYTLNSVLRSHGVRLTAASLESDSAQGQAKRISEVAMKAATGMRQQLAVSVEASVGELRQTVQQKAGVLSKSKNALGSAISKINGRAKELEASPVQLSHAGIYDFLHRSGAPLSDLKGAMKQDLEVIETLRNILVEFTKEYDGLAALKDATSEAGVQTFLKYLATMNYMSSFGQVDGAQLLGNGQLTVQDESVHEVAGSTILDLSYGATKNDGSKNTLGQRALSSSWRAGLGLVVGGAVGSIVGMSTVGAAIGASAGVYKGVKAADYKVRGNETQSHTSVADVLEFLKDAQKVCEYSSDILKFVNTAAADDQKARQYMKTLVATIDKDDKFATAAFNVGGAVLSALAKSRGIGIDAPVIKSHKQQLQESVGDMLDNTHMAYVSVLDALATHCFVCVTGSMEVADAIVKAEA